MKKYYTTFLIIISLTLLLTGCKHQIGKGLPENFDVFYKRFISDSMFQLSRITFPLKCDISEKNIIKSFIDKQDWKPIRVSIDNVDRKIYKVDKKNTTSEVSHRIYIENSDVDIQLRYRLIKRKWYLVYYKNIML